MGPEAKMAQRSFTIHQVADLLGASGQEVDSWISRGWLDCHQIGGEGPRRVSEVQLVKFLKAQGIDIQLLANAIAKTEAAPEPSPKPQPHQTQVATIEAPPEQPRESEQATDDEEVTTSEPPPPPPTTPAGQIIDALLADAAAAGASTIHLELRKDELSVRLRLGGQLQEKTGFRRRLPPGLPADVVSELQRIAAEGGFARCIDGVNYTCRLTSLPTVEGQLLTVELSPASIAGLDLLGLGDDDLRALRGIVNRGWGLAIVTGPPRSGCGELAAAIMHELGGPGKSCVAVLADAYCRPPGIACSSPCRGPAALAESLAVAAAGDHDAILTDIIDPAGAAAAMLAARRGAMVVARMTEPTVTDAIDRLREMGVDGWELSTLSAGVCTARTVRLLCTRCRRESQSPDSRELPAELARQGMEFGFFVPAGCKDCRNGGYSGRAMLAGVLVANGDTGRVFRQSRPGDVASLWVSATNLLKTGATSIEEILRVLRPHTTQ
jgi:general secretion pathway protein E